MKKILAVLLAAAMSACSPATLTTSFDANAAKFINAAGLATVEGQAFLRRNDGMVVYAAGSEVNLIPVTAYSTERMTTIYGGGKLATFGREFKNDSAEYYKYVRTMIADGEGRFTFPGVADGDYYVVTSVRWLAGGMDQGGWLMERVTVSGGQNQQIILRGI